MAISSSEFQSRNSLMLTALLKVKVKVQVELSSVNHKHLPTPNYGVHVVLMGTYITV